MRLYLRHYAILNVFPTIYLHLEDIPMQRISYALLYATSVLKSKIVLLPVLYNFCHLFLWRSLPFLSLYLLSFQPHFSFIWHNTYHYVWHTVFIMVFNNNKNIIFNNHKITIAINYNMCKKQFRIESFPNVLLLWPWCQLYSWGIKECKSMSPWTHFIWNISKCMLHLFNSMIIHCFRNSSCRIFTQPWFTHPNFIIIS